VPAGTTNTATSCCGPVNPLTWVHWGIRSWNTYYKRGFSGAIAWRPSVETMLSRNVNVYFFLTISKTRLTVDACFAHQWEATTADAAFRRPITSYHVIPWRQRAHATEKRTHFSRSTRFLCCGGNIVNICNAAMIRTRWPEVKTNWPYTLNLK